MRYPFAVRWARARGVLLVRDCLDGTWLAVDAAQCPPAWARWATEDANRKRAEARQ